jgi:hypothetical protein
MANKSKAKSTLDLSGAYYNPEKSGWGLFIVNYGEDTQSIQVFTYDNKGNQVWLVGVSPRGTGNFTLLKPSASGPFDQITGYATGPNAGRIDLDLVEPGKLKYTAHIFNRVINPGTQFSPPPPDVHVFEGVVVKI